MSEQFTIKELYKAIKEETMNVNKRLVSYYEDGDRSKLVDKEIAILKDVSGTSQKRPYLSLNLHRKNKNQLIAQLNFLRDFQSWDILTPEGRRIENERAYRAYKSFKENRPNKNLKFKTYRRAVTILGSLSSRIIDNFNSNQIIEAVEVAFQKGRKVKDIIQTFEKVDAEFKKKAHDPEDYIDEWYRQMKL